MIAERKLTEQLGDVAVTHEWAIESESQDNVDRFMREVEAQVKRILSERTQTK